MNVVYCNFASSQLVVNYPVLSLVTDTGPSQHLSQSNWIKNLYAYCCLAAVSNSLASVLIGILACEFLSIGKVLQIFYTVSSSSRLMLQHNRTKAQGQDCPAYCPVCAFLFRSLALCLHFYLGYIQISF